MMSLRWRIMGATVLVVVLTVCVSVGVAITRPSPAWVCSWTGLAVTDAIRLGSGPEPGVHGCPRLADGGFPSCRTRDTSTMGPAR